jgi:teichuronic acid biosynthesis glycosyltransferase TuaG
MNDLVSIIMPSYNTGRYIADSIRSVQAQTYGNWELLIVDDCSTDASAEIIGEYARKDPRIRYIKLSENSGAAIARNTGLEAARGRYIAYLDADDLWFPQKLERQLDFLSRNNVGFSCCAYEKIEQDGSSLKKTVWMPKTMNYHQLLKNTIIQTVGVIVDTKLVNPALLVMPNVRRGQDFATWLQILRSGILFHGQPEVLAAYRRVATSLSANKLRAFKRTWHVYRQVEHLPFLYAAWCQVSYAYHACIKRIYAEKYLTAVKGFLHIL